MATDPAGFKDAIISTAITLFVERGYDETTVAEIAEAAEVAPRTFFRCFATKDGVALPWP
ncbi:TetR family transcriptional regulator [Streptomyces ossamyceticus]